MPQVAIPHVMGTVILLGLLAIVVLYSQNIQFSHFHEATEAQLKDISGYVSSELISISDLASSSGSPQFLYKVISIPKSVNGEGYSIEIVNRNGIYGILVYLDRYSHIYGFTPLFFNITEGVSLVENGVININSNTRIVIVDRLYSGTRKPVVWVRFNGTHIEFGLGRLEGV